MKLDKIYLDADGVIADFDKKVEEITGQPICNLHKSKMWASIKKYNSGGGRFWYDLDYMADGLQLIEYVQSLNIPYEILTATGYEPTSGPDKIQWFGERLPDVPVNLVTKSADKAKFASPNVILIDDRLHSITPWNDAGGIGILHTNTSNTILIIEELLKGR